MTAKVIANLTSKYKKVQKEVGEIMVGKTLDYEAKRILNEGIKMGREQGIELGIDQGIDRGMQLLRKLNEDGQAETADLLLNGKLSKEEQKNLFHKYGIN